MPGIDDHELCIRILQLPLGERSRADVQSLADRLVPGRYGQISRQMRDKLWKFAVQNGAIKRGKPQKKNLVATVHVDTYDIRETKGTELAVAHLAKYTRLPDGRMLVPPGRRHA